MDHYLHDIFYKTSALYFVFFTKNHQEKFREKKLMGEMRNCYRTWAITGFVGAFSRRDCVEHATTVNRPR